MNTIGNFIRELRRRRVFRVAALYIVGAWVVLQAADLAFPGLQIPDSAIRYIWIGALAGFPVALILGWRFDFVHGRMVHTSIDSEGEALALSGADYAVLSILTIVVVAITIGLTVEIMGTRQLSSAQISIAIVDPKSIAVLPFENMSRDPANEPLTAGIHDDVLTHISKLSDIKVISRTSVARLDKNLSIRDIGQTLGVATVLEGGVQRSGDRVRINAQLIDAISDQHLWADTFDRELTTQNIFEIQSEIAAAITDKLQATLSPQDEAQLSKLPTQNLQAYEAYLLGKHRMTKRTKFELMEAIKHFEAAVELDPNYALAYVGLADAYLLMGTYGHLSSASAVDKAEQPLLKALELDDQLGAAYASLYLSRVRQNDIAGAETAFKRAIELDPNYATPYHWYGDLQLNYFANPKTALPFLEKARDLDPLSPVINVTLGEAHEGLGNFEEAMKFYRKAIEIDPDFPGAYFVIGIHYRTVKNQMDEAVRWHRKVIALEPAGDLAILGFTYLDLGDDAKAEYWIDRNIRLHPNWFVSSSAKAFLHRYRGEETQAIRVARHMLTIFPGNNTSIVTLVNYGQYQEVLEKVASDYPELSCDTEPIITRNNLSQAINISLALEKTGESDCADRLLVNILEQLQHMPRLGARGYGIADVEIYARQGKTRLALDTLRQAIDEGYRAGWWAQGEGSPHMVSLLDEPEFKAMMDEIRADMATQLARVREIEANGELATIPVEDPN